MVHVCTVKIVPHPYMNAGHALLDGSNKRSKQGTDFFRHILEIPLTLEIPSQGAVANRFRNGMVGKSGLPVCHGIVISAVRAQRTGLTQISHQLPGLGTVSPGNTASHTQPESMRIGSSYLRRDVTGRCRNRSGTQG